MNCFKKYALLLIFIGCIVHVDALGQSFPFKFSYLTVDEGLSHTDANDITQDRRGYIWVATNFGLDRYDGYTIKKYYNQNVPLNNSFKNRITCLFPDNDGTIWLGTEGGVQRFDPVQEKYTDYHLKNAAPGPRLWKIGKATGNVIYGLTDGRFKAYRAENGALREIPLNAPKGITFTHFARAPGNRLYLSGSKGLWVADQNMKFRKVVVGGLPTENLSRVYVDRANNLILSGANQLFRLKKNASGVADSFVRQQEFTMPQDAPAYDIQQSANGDYWINTGAQLLRLDPDLNLVQTVNNHQAYSLNSNALNGMFIDRSECLWVCTFGGGVNYCDLNQKLFYTLQHHPGSGNTLSGNHIRSVLEDKQDLWVGTTANGLNLYNLTTHQFNHYNTYNSPVRLKHDEVAALALDDERNLWIGTGAGIDILKPDRKSLWKPLGYEHFPNFKIETLTKDMFGNIWFGNHTDRFGVIWKDKANRWHVRYYDEGYFIFAEQNRPQLFVSSTKGLRRMVIDKEGNILRSYHYSASSKPNALSSDYTYPIARQNDSTYWIGTIGGGLNRLAIQKNNAYTIKAFADRYGIFKDVESLEIDDMGNVWMGGNGLLCFNPSSQQLTRYERNDGLQGNSFKVGASNKGSGGRLYFGGINGLNYFYPQQIKTNKIPATPVLTGILINNEKPRYGSASEIALGYRQNNFVIFFSAMHFANPLKCLYRYKLEGFDATWKYTDGTNPSASYSNLPYKTYRFVVQASNNDGLWSSATAESRITVSPPWWNSNLARAFYGLLLASGLIGIYVYQARWYRLKREVAVRELNEKLYQQQLTFFTNISHEFRTPLSLIIGPLEGLISRNTNPAVQQSYELMLRNARRLINLVAELMNFRKASDSLLKLRVQRVSVIDFYKNVAEEFQPLAVNKMLRFTLADRDAALRAGQPDGYFDLQIVEKILYNLLNNAFKYSGAGGSVSFEILDDIGQFKPSFATGFSLRNDYRGKRYVYFKIRDEGIGISAESIDKIFDRYYRVSNDHLGSGIGLALVKSLTHLHKGDLHIYSERHKGTEILVGIPIDEEDYNESEKAGNENDPGMYLEATGASDQEAVPGAPSEPAVIPGNKRILLVEDNDELRGFLKQTLGAYYQVYEAENGRAAFDIALEVKVDLVISDVMMPEMDGIELCRLMKDTFETSHIPFLILSARDALDTKIAGMASGADYYFEKPLNMELLLLTLQNLFAKGERLREKYIENYLSQATELVSSEKDISFLNKVLTVIEENIQEPNLDVEFLCEHLYISRTKLYNKIKDITGQSVAEFVRTYRLKKAVEMMTHEDVSMAQVADRIGMQSSTNFSRAFKKAYGKPPLQFIQDLRK